MAGYTTRVAQVYESTDSKDENTSIENYLEYNHIRFSKSEYPSDMDDNSTLIDINEDYFVLENISYLDADMRLVKIPNLQFHNNTVRKILFLAYNVLVNSWMFRKWKGNKYYSLSFIINLEYVFKFIGWNKEIYN